MSTLSTEDNFLAFVLDVNDFSLEVKFFLTWPILFIPVLECPFPPWTSVFTEISCLLEFDGPILPRFGLSGA